MDESKPSPAACHFVSLSRALRTNSQLSPCPQRSRDRSRALRDTQRPKRSSPMNCLPGDRNPATGEAPPTQILRRKIYELSNML